jgi:VWFA-related protein
MKRRMLMVFSSALAIFLVALISVVAGVGDIIEINGDLVDLTKANSKVSFADFSTDVAEVTITKIDSSAFPVIKVYVDVTDSFGVQICGLTEEDFCVSQDGEPVEFELSSLDVEACPTSVCLVMDVSGSMWGAPLSEAKEAARVFIRNMGPKSRAAIVSYSDCVQTLQTFTSDTTLLLNAINSLWAMGMTALFDGFWLGVDLTCPETSIKAVIGFTDGQENNSQFCWPPPDGKDDAEGWADDCDTVTYYADSCGFPIYTIGVTDYAWSDPLICLAEKTGGQYYYIPTTAQLDSIYQKIQSRLCCRYLITYTSPDTDCVKHEVVVCEGGELCTPCDTAYYRGLYCPPTLKRTPPTIALSDNCQPPSVDLTIEAWAVDTVPPPVQEVDLYWRINGSGPTYTKVVMSHVSDSLYRGIIPGASLPPGTVGVDYYLTATDGEYTVSNPSTDPATSPYFIEICHNQPPELTCPDDDSVHAGDNFFSTDYSVTDPDDPTESIVVTLHSVSPTPANAPALVDKHIEWLSACADLGTGPVFTIKLMATDPEGAKDSCEFTVKVYNNPPEIDCPEDDSVHAEELFLSTAFSFSDPDEDEVIVSLCGINPSPVNQPVIVENKVQWQTDCDDAGKTFTICLQAVDECGDADTCFFDVKVYNYPPELTCPDDGIIIAGETFVSSDFSVTDPDGDTAPVSFLDISPSAANDPTIEGSHVEWVTTAGELRDYTIRLVTTDPCGLADTCEFSVTVDEPTGDFSCPDDDSVHAGNLFVSTNYTLTHPECDPSSVEILDITPAPTYAPSLVEYHVQWQTTCEEDGEYVIRLRTGERCSVIDTCSFTVTVYNHPPQLTCPDYGRVLPTALFISTDFFVFDPDGDDTWVYLLGIDPPAEHDPVIVERHVEWQTECVEGDYIITLMTVDECGLADTCEFMVTVAQDPVPDFYIWVYPFTQYIAAGHAAGFIVELNSLNSFHFPCSLLVSGLPNPPNDADFGSPVMIPTDTTTMMVYTTPATPQGPYILTVTGKEIGGLRQHSVQVKLVVGAPTDAGEWTEDTNAPKSFTLFQNMPNPFNPETQISYYLPRDCQVELTIYDVLGRKVRTLFEGYDYTGTHTVTWDGRADNGSQLGSGIYFYRLRADLFDQTKKMVLMK